MTAGNDLVLLQTLENLHGWELVPRKELTPHHTVVFVSPCAGVLDKGFVGVWHYLRSLGVWGWEGAVLGVTLQQPEVGISAKARWVVMAPTQSPKAQQVDLNGILGRSSCL